MFIHNICSYSRETRSFGNLMRSNSASLHTGHVVCPPTICLGTKKMRPDKISRCHRRNRGRQRENWEISKGIFIAVLISGAVWLWTRWLCCIIMFTVKICCLFKVSFAGRILCVICIIYLSTCAVDVEHCSDVTSKMNAILSEGRYQFDSCCQCCPSLQQNSQVNCFITEYIAALVQNCSQVHTVNIYDMCINHTTVTLQ